MLSLARRPLVAALTLLASLVVTAAATAQSPPAIRSLVGRTFTARVTAVVDGDTVDVALAAGPVIRVRLEGIDAPERGQPFSAEARTAARVALFDQSVSLRATDVDRYDRLVARIAANGRDVSLVLVEAGLACHFTPYSSDPTLAAAQAHAKSHARGFWAAGGQRPSACSATTSSPPAAAPVGTSPRSALSSAACLAAEEFHGNRRSKVYPQASCRNYNCPNCVVVFGSHQEAQKAGFRPAGDCFR